MTSASDGIDGATGALVLDESMLEVLRRLFGVQAVQVDVDFTRRRAVLVPLLIQEAGGFPVGFPHQIILRLTPEAQGFGGASVITIPSLSGAGRDSVGYASMLVVDSPL